MVSEALREKLKRAQEHIETLERESAAFLDAAPQRTFIGDDAVAAEAFRTFQRGRPVPARLSVVTGEAIQQLRSCMDHIICALIRSEGTKPSLSSQFPVFLEEPTDKDARGRYNAQIKGITRDAIRGVIESHQPYKRGERRRYHWLYALQQLSNRDKHHSLLFHVVWPESRLSVTIDGPEGWTITSSQPDDGEPPNLGMMLGGEPVNLRAIERSIVPIVAFAELSELRGNDRNFAVAPSVSNLHDAVSRVLDELIPFLPESAGTPA